MEQIARKGVFVKEITSKDIYDTYESKGIIEGFLATEFALHATPKDIDTLSLHVEQMSDLNSDKKKVVKVGEDFHKLTLKYAKNSIFLDTLEKINKKSQLTFLQKLVENFTLKQKYKRDIKK